MKNNIKFLCLKSSKIRLKLKNSANKKIKTIKTCHGKGKDIVDKRKIFLQKVEDFLIKINRLQIF
jgi:hypothetical protein